MTDLIEQFISCLWNLLTKGASAAAAGLDLGWRVRDGVSLRQSVLIPHNKRLEHVAVLGKTGQGKSFFLRHVCIQDIQADRGFVFFDLHGDTMPFLLSFIAGEERRRGKDLSARLIVVEPADPEYSLGLNVLERATSVRDSTQIGEFVQVLKQHWHLDAFGARTEELLRNALQVLADNQLTILEIPALLTNPAFRASCLRRVGNPEVADYFNTRFDRASEGMQSVLRDALLNKVTGFAADFRFRHILGQRHSTFSLLDAMDGGAWVIVNLDKGRLGEQASTLGSLLLTKIKNALFARRRRTLFTLYCDEIQNLVSFGSGIDTLLSESRKFGISIFSANQFLDQYPPPIRSAILAIGTHVFFQLSSVDADKIAAALDGGRKLAERLKNLPKRHMIVKSGAERWHEVMVPTLPGASSDSADLYNRSRARWAKPRTEVEQEIRARREDAARNHDEVLHEWE